MNINYVISEGEWDLIAIDGLTIKTNGSQFLINDNGKLHPVQPAFPLKDLLITRYSQDQVSAILYELNVRYIIANKVKREVIVNGLTLTFTLQMEIVSPPKLIATFKAQQKPELDKVTIEIKEALPSAIQQLVETEFESIIDDLSLVASSEKLSKRYLRIFFERRNYIYKER